jgi:hypothetical protein
VLTLLSVHSRSTGMLVPCSRSSGRDAHRSVQCPSGARRWRPLRPVGQPAALAQRAQPSARCGSMRSPGAEETPDKSLDARTGSTFR